MKSNKFVEGVILVGFLFLTLFFSYLVFHSLISQKSFTTIWATFIIVFVLIGIIVISIVLSLLNKKYKKAL